MSVNLTINHQSLIKQQTHCWAAAWIIERTDGVIMHFTDHNESLLIGSSSYLPAGGFNPSARQKQSDLRTQNLEVKGVLSSDSITNDDLRAGRYREAKITELVVDWRVPWVGAFVTNVYWISEVTFSEFGWEAQIQGLTRWLRGAVGDVYGRTCRHTLGDSGCKVDLGLITVSKAVTAVFGNLRDAKFYTTLVGANALYTFGLLTWTSGLNNGLSFEIKRFHSANGEVTLHLPCPFNVQVGDTFTAYPGCNKLRSTCHDKFRDPDDPTNALGIGNLKNYGGFNDIPGTDRMIRVNVPPPQ